MAAFEQARLGFVAKLDDDERAMLQSAAGPEDLLADIRRLDEQHQDKSLLRRLMGKIEPCVRGFEQYVQAMDVYSNAKPEVLSLLWGSVRIILRVSTRTCVQREKWNSDHLQARTRLYRHV